MCGHQLTKPALHNTITEDLFQTPFIQNEDEDENQDETENWENYENQNDDEMEDQDEDKNEDHDQVQDQYQDDPPVASCRAPGTPGSL